MLLVPIVLVALCAATLAALLYNRIVGLRNRAHGAWSDVDVQLARRRDLVPALVEVVRGYAGHELNALAAAASERARALDRSGDRPSPREVEARASSETALSAALADVLVVAEAYPDLMAHERFASLHTSLVAVEGDIADARRYYNAVVRDLNNAVETFPGVLVAGATGVSRLPFFELAPSTERDAVSVSLGRSAS